MKPQLHLSLASPKGVEIILLQAKARGLVNPERYLISLRKHTLDAQGSHHKLAINLTYKVEDCLEKSVTVKAEENSVDQVANDEGLQSVGSAVQAGVAIEEQRSGNFGNKCALIQSQNGEEPDLDDFFVEEDSVVVLFSNTECGFRRHEVDKLDSAAVYSFAITAVFDESKLSSGSDHEATAISARFFSAPVMRLAEWSEMAEYCLAVDFGSAPLGSRLLVRVEDVATCIGGDLKLDPGVTCAFLNPRDLLGVEFADNMKLQVRAKVLLSDIEPDVKGSDWSEWAQLETLELFKKKVERDTTEASLAEELARKRTREQEISDAGDDSMDSNDDYGSGDEVVLAAAAEESGKRPCRKARSSNQTASVSDAVNSAAEADVRKPVPEPSSRPNTAAGLSPSKAVSVPSTSPDGPVNAVVKGIKKELLFAPQYRRPVKKNWQGAPSSSKGIPAQNTDFVKSVKAPAPRASSAAGTGNTEPEYGEVKEVEIVEVSDSDDYARASVESVAKVIRPEGWPASI